MGFFSAALAAASVIGGLSNSRRKAPGAPGYVGESGRAATAIGGDLSELGRDLGERQQPLLNNIGPAYDQYRSQLGEFVNTGRSQLGALNQSTPLWNQADSMLARDVLNAGSPGEIGRQRQMAWDDSMTGLRAQGQADELLRRQSGLGVRGGAGSVASRFGHLAGSAANQAGERERQFGIGLRTQTAGISGLRRQEQLALSRLPADVQREIGGTYAQQADLYHKVIAPYLNTMTSAASVYQGNANLGRVQAGADQYAEGTNFNRRASFFNQLGSLGSRF